MGIQKEKYTVSKLLTGPWEWEWIISRLGFTHTCTHCMFVCMRCVYVYMIVLSQIKPRSQDSKLPFNYGRLHDYLSWSRSPFCRKISLSCHLEVRFDGGTCLSQWNIRKWCETPWGGNVESQRLIHHVLFLPSPMTTACRPPLQSDDGDGAEAQP